MSARPLARPAITPGLYAFGLTFVRVVEMPGTGRICARIERGWDAIADRSFQRAAERIHESRRARAWCAAHGLGLVK